MNKEAILQANDELLDEWCAKYVMHWEQNQDFRVRTEEETILYMTYKGDVMYGKPYRIIDGSLFERDWDYYTPTETTDQSLDLLPLVATEWRIEGNDKGQWSVSIKSNRGDPATERIKWYHGEANSMAKAIVFACLSAVTEDGEA